MCTLLCLAMFGLFALLSPLLVLGKLFLCCFGDGILSIWMKSFHSRKSCPASGRCYDAVFIVCFVLFYSGVGELDVANEEKY